MSLPDLFGNLGGLYEFLATAMLYLIGTFQSRAFSLDFVSSHFRTPRRGARDFDPSHGLPGVALHDKLFSKIKTGVSQNLKLSFWLCYRWVASRRERQLKAMLEVGEDKLGTALDTRSIIKLQRAFATLIRFEHSRATRTLLNFQRRQTVLEYAKPGKAE